MTNLVTQLRQMAAAGYAGHDVAAQAADEIERLRNKVAALVLVAYGTPENPRDPLASGGTSPCTEPNRTAPESDIGAASNEQSLLPCPFCGAHAELRHITSHEVFDDVAQEWKPAGKWRIDCPTRDCILYDLADEGMTVAKLDELVARWNRRSSPEPSPPQMTACVECGGSGCWDRDGALVLAKTCKACGGTGLVPVNRRGES